MHAYMCAMTFSVFAEVFPSSKLQITFSPSLVNNLKNVSSSPLKPSPLAPYSRLPSSLSLSTQLVAEMRTVPSPCRVNFRHGLLPPVFPAFQFSGGTRRNLSPSSRARICVCMCVVCVCVSFSYLTEHVETRLLKTSLN